MVELMPVFQFDPADGNYWGYMPLQLLRPPSRLRSGHAIDVAAQRVPRDGQGAARGGHRGHPRRRLQPHRRGRAHGARLQLQGHRQQHLLPDGGPAGRPYANFSGTGNTLNCANRYVRKMILDSLRYWVQRDARRRLPLRPRLRLHAQPGRLAQRTRTRRSSATSPPTRTSRSSA